jgi:hypothetical protein
MNLLAWLLGPLSFREQLALAARFLGWLFGRTIDVEPETSPANSTASEHRLAPRPKAEPIRFCVALYHLRTGKLIGVGKADFPEWVTAVLEANYFNSGCTLPIVAQPVPLTRAMRRARGELNKVQLLTTIAVVAPPGSVDDLPHGAPPDASMPTGQEPSAASPPVWPHEKRRAS